MRFDKENAERPLAIMGLAHSAVNTYCMSLFLDIPVYLIVSINKSLTLILRITAVGW